MDGLRAWGVWDESVGKFRGLDGSRAQGLELGV